MEMILEDETDAMDIQFDSINQKIIWISPNTDIVFANPDGSNKQTLYGGGGHIISLDIHFSSQKLYFLDRGPDLIFRCDLNGDNVEEIISTDLFDAKSITINNTTDQLYWTNNGQLYRSTIEGDNIEILGSAPGLDGLPELAIDEIEGKIYWMNSFDSSIYRCNLDGSDIQLFREAFASSSFPSFIYIDSRIEVLLDQDQDGFTSDVDCDDTNPDINPDATEIPNNGIDEDCDGEDLVISTKESEAITIKIFPNPTKQFFHLEQSGQRSLSLKLRSITGDLLLTRQINQKQATLNLEALPPGTYFIELQSEFSYVVERIIKL